MSKRHISPAVRAALWMLGAVVSLSAMAIGGRELSAELSTFQILFFRSLVGLAVIAALLQRSGWGQVRTRVFGLHLVRNVSHYAGQFGWFFALGVIPLSEVFAIEFTTPIWTALLAALVLGERMNKLRMAAVAVGFVGVLVILRPGISAVSVGSLSVLGAAGAYALTYIMTKKLTGTETPLSILFYMTAMQLPLGFAAALIDWRWPQAWAWPWVFTVAITALVAHYCMTRAFRLADATVVVPLDFLRLPLIALLGLLLYGEALDAWVMVGAACVLLASWMNLKSVQPVPLRAT
jgi:drug/metabolite transporter (DMT)-like permease